MLATEVHAQVCVHFIGRERGERERETHCQHEEREGDGGGRERGRGGRKGERERVFMETGLIFIFLMENFKFPLFKVQNVPVYCEMLKLGAFYSVSILKTNPSTRHDEGIKGAV